MSRSGRPRAGMTSLELGFEEHWHIKTKHWCDCPSTIRRYSGAFYLGHERCDTCWCVMPKREFLPTRDRILD